MTASLSRRRLLLAGAGTVSIPAWPPLAQAANAGSGYPQRALHLVSPYPPGGTNDLVARITGRELSALLGQPVVIDNRGGAGGTLGTNAVVQVVPDGYTLLNASSGNLTSAPQVIGAPYDPLNDLVPVGFLGHVRFVLAVNPALPIRSLAELIAYARANPGKINYGTAGNGTGGHIAGEYLRQRTGIDIVHVPYRGSALAVSDALAGHVQLVLDPLAGQYVRDGRLRGLAFSGARSAPDLPGVPSIDEAGVPKWEATNFFLAAVPRNTPKPVVEALLKAYAEIAAKPAVVKELQALGVEILPLQQQQITELIKAEIALNNRVIQAAQIRG
ncbi:Bug family tripartite tricarboxylate transporter substrate binding protein [Comamonas antarctica]|uniref:Tripartite tricarboxylate transporter substrate binding protein n=1 Tax=Comamonas antarctica TaxID=2743470 RepID=A0A6N1X886_9BURK|nr:tripartite tricarboxylate transporter substrate binding protein [Comamonas antarctica]QKV55589.1 tripartite tricarboxylate transporter substrate binding protein [Comamonas antarctica]